MKESPPGHQEETPMMRDAEDIENAAGSCCDHSEPRKIQARYHDAR